MVSAPSLASLEGDDGCADTWLIWLSVALSCCLAWAIFWSSPARTSFCCASSCWFLNCRNEIARAFARCTASAYDGALTDMRSTRLATTVTVVAATKLSVLCRRPSLRMAIWATARLCAMVWSVSIAEMGSSFVLFVTSRDVAAE